MTEQTGSGGLRARLLGAFGQSRTGGVRTRAAAEALNVSPRTIQRWTRGDASPSKESAARLADVEHAESHRPKWISPSDEGTIGNGLLRDRRLPPVQDVRAQLHAVYGRPDGKLDSKRASADLGVSPRTIQRWARGDARPKVDAQAKLRNEVRRDGLSGKRGSRLRNMGSRVSLGTVLLTISSETRPRSIPDLRLGSAQMQELITAWESGGDAAAQQVLEDAIKNSAWGRGVFEQAGGRLGDNELSLAELESLDFPRN